MEERMARSTGKEEMLGEEVRVKGHKRHVLRDWNKEMERKK